MSHAKNEKIINSLRILLDQERAALLDGNLEAIAVLLQRKELLIDQLNTQVPKPSDAISELQGKVIRNQELLDGALEGIRKVAARMAAVRRIRNNLETYDESGRKSEISGVVDHKVEKRA